MSSMTSLDQASTAPAPSTRWEPSSLTETRARRWLGLLKRNRVAVLSIAILLFIAVIGLAAPYLATHDAMAISAADRSTAPSASHMMGTDNLGRDLYSRILFGIRMTAMIACISIAIASLFGVTIGLLAGYVGGWADEIFMRLMDIIYAFPPLLLALALVATLGTGMDSIVVAISIGRVPGFARVTRSAVLSVRESEYLQAALSIGASHTRIIWRHILPNCIAPIIVIGTLSIAVAILVEASLSFLGLGIQPPNPSLGGLLKDALPFMRQAPWLAIFPGAAIALIVFVLNLAGDRVRDLLDPSLR